MVSYLVVLLRTQTKIRLPDSNLTQDIHMDIYIIVEYTFISA